MADVRESWSEVASQMNELGLKLQLHYEQAADEDAPEAETAAEDDAKVKEAMRVVGDAVEQAFGALSTAVGDDAVREDLKDVGQSLVNALEATFEEVSDRVKTALKSD